MMHEDIILATLAPDYVPFEYRDRGDYIRNQDILATFADTPEIPIPLSSLAILYKPSNGITQRLEFDAKRAGEMMRWGIENGVIAPILLDYRKQFKLLESEPLYVLVGPSNNRRQVRVRRWRSAEEEKHCQKELKREADRLERARLKQVTKIRGQAEVFLSEILARDIEAPIHDRLQKYAVPGVSKLVEIQNYLLDQILAGSAKDAREIVAVLEFGYIDVRRKRLPEPTSVSFEDDDLDIIGSM